MNDILYLWGEGKESGYERGKRLIRGKPLRKY
jgi:hypothetical protein